MHEEFRSGRTRRPLIGERRGLRAELLAEAALRRSGRKSFADRSFFRALQCLTDSFNREAGLSAFGQLAAKYDIARCLRNLLRFDALEAACPSVLNRPISAPLFITGMPRSGTTFLHRLILQDPRMAAPRLVHLVHPLAARQGRIGAQLRHLSVRMQVSIFRLIAPELNALHPIAVDEPEECGDITAQVFQSLRFDSMYRVPTYRAWLQRNGCLEAYRFHRRFLQHLDAQLPGRRWVLKAPDHVFALQDLRRVYPDARLVCVHRDPVRVLASVAKLTEVLRRPFASSIDRAEIGGQVSSAWIEGAQRMSELADCGSVLHLTYRQITGAPLDAVREVYRHCSIDLDQAAEARMRAWLRTSRNAPKPRRHYDLAQFGLDPQQLRERFQIYTRVFGIELEAEDAGIGPLAK